MTSASTAELCFNCNGTGYDTFYPFVESRVRLNVLNVFEGFETGQEWQTPCPYCKPFRPSDYIFF